MDPSHGGKTDWSCEQVSSKALASLAKATHCIVHQEALVLKILHADLKLVLDEAMRTVNFINFHPLQLRLFAKLCLEMGRNQLQLHQAAKSSPNFLDYVTK